MIGVGPESFEAWYIREHPRVLSALTVIARNADLAAEATDEAFARAYERWSRVSRMDAPGGWTYRTALHALRRRARRRQLEHRLLLRTASDTAVAPTDWSPEVWDALVRLPLRERTAIALRYVAGLTNIEVAEAMDTAPGTVAAALHSARAKLAVALNAPDVSSDLEDIDD